MGRGKETEQFLIFLKMIQYGVIMHYTRSDNPRNMANNEMKLYAYINPGPVSTLLNKVHTGFKFI